MQTNLESILQFCINGNFLSENHKQQILLQSQTSEQSFWNCCPSALKNLEHCFSAFKKLSKIGLLNYVIGAGIKIPIQSMNLQYIWLKLLPLCLKFENMQKENRILIGLAGPPGSGKTVFSEILKESLNILFSREKEEACCILGQDAYHLPNSYLGRFSSFNKNNILSDSHFTQNTEGKQVPWRTFKGDPLTFDILKFVEDLKRIKESKNKQVLLPVYDRNLHDPVPDAQKIEPTHRFVIVEGMLLLYDESGFENIKKELDISIYIDVDEEKCHQRLVARKVEGGRSREDSEKHYERVDKVNIKRIVDKKQRADILLKVNDGNLFSSIEFGSIK